MINALILMKAAYYATPMANPQIDRVKLAQYRTAIQNAQESASKAGKKLSPNSNVIKDYKSLLPAELPLDIFSMSLGHMLGDVSVKYDASKDQATIHFEWGNSGYASYVYNMMYDYVLSKPRIQTRVNANGNNVTTYCFQTITHPSFAVLHHLFIVDGVKTVPTGLIENLLTPLALATWFMDDGGQTDYRTGHGYGLQLNTQGFTLDTVEQMTKELNNKYSLDCWMRVLNNKGGKPIIVIPSKSYPKFYDLVQGYVDSSMKHKLPTPR